MRWLGKQIDEDEEVAREAGKRSMEWRLVTPLDDAELGDAFWLNPPEKYHAERHDPARVLRETDAKRRILARHTPHSMDQCTECDAPHWGVQVCNHCQLAWPCPDILDVAASYANHRDFPPELRP